MLDFSVKNIFLISDIHLSLSNKDVISSELLCVDYSDSALIIAGDISTSYGINSYFDFFDSLSKSFKVIFYVLGNHDYWGGGLFSAKEKYELFFSDFKNIFALHKGPYSINEFLIYGDTLWTNSNPSNDTSEMLFRTYMNDSRYITDENGYKCIKLINLFEEFNYQFSLLSNFVSSNSDKNLIVVTHHAPSFRSVDSIYENSILNEFYYSKLDDFILKNKNIKKWIHGHMHHRDIFSIGECNIYLNPYGYVSGGKFNRREIKELFVFKSIL